ncbi:MAG: fructosamine kinase family protein [Pseudomonadota bacterium]
MIDIASASGLNPDRLRFEPVSGGSIAHAYRLSDGNQTAFVKCMNSQHANVLEAECAGLRLLADTQTVAIPEVIASGRFDQLSWLALRWIDMQPLSDLGEQQLGQQLAAMHRHQAERYGLNHDNFIGRTPQPNDPDKSWTDFFFTHRIGFQLQLLDRNDSSQPWQEWLCRLRQCWEKRFDRYQPPPSLLHGDLWSGNAAQTEYGNPLVFDPAVHYGDRECDLAMMDLFGGFSQCFYDSYQASWPLEKGWQKRRPYYQLYHVLNHANLFSGHYVSSCKKRIKQIVG